MHVCEGGGVKVCVYVREEVKVCVHVRGRKTGRMHEEGGGGGGERMCAEGRRA